MKRRFDSELIDKVYEIVRHASKAAPITSKEIARLLNISDAEANPITRALLVEVMRVKQIPLAGKGDGFFVVKTVAELKESRLLLECRIRGIQRRLALMMATYFQSHPRESLDGWD